MGNPMYRQIAEDLRVQIESGALHPGQQLQTEVELRQFYGASRNTSAMRSGGSLTSAWSRRNRARATSSSSRSTRSSAP